MSMLNILKFTREPGKCEGRRGRKSDHPASPNTFLRDLIILLPQVSWFHQTKHGYDLNTRIPRMTEFPFANTDLDLTLSRSNNR